MAACAQPRDRRLGRMARFGSQAGRQWTCADRAVGGYPFRIEVACSSLAMRQGQVALALGPIRSVAQVYRPGHIIAEIGGPMRLTDGHTSVEGSWRLAETSIRVRTQGLQRASVVVEEPNVRIAGLTPTELSLGGRRVEAHVRPAPAHAASDRAVDVAIGAAGARLPMLDAWMGGTEPADLEVDLTATHALGFTGRPLVEEMEQWRQSGGRIDLERLFVAKGARRAEAKGELALDELHRPTGRLNVAASGLDELVAAVTGDRNGSGSALLGALLGQTPARENDTGRQGAGSGQAALAPLPPLRLAEGRVYLGPFALPGVRLQPLY